MCDWIALPRARNSSKSCWICSIGPSGADSYGNLQRQSHVPGQGDRTSKTRSVLCFRSNSNPILLLLIGRNRERGNANTHVVRERSAFRARIQPTLTEMDAGIVFRMEEKLP